MTTLARRLGRVERSTAEERAAIAARDTRAIRERQRDIMRSFTFEPGMIEALETLTGAGSYHGMKLVIADEHEIEKALVKYTEAYAAAAAKHGYTMEELEPLIPGRLSFLPIDDTAFNRDLHRFARASFSNAAVALRFSNAVTHRTWPGEIHRNEWAAAKAVFEPRFEAFLAEERRGSTRARRAEVAA